MGYYRLSEAADTDWDNDEAWGERMGGKLGVEFVQEGGVAFYHPL